MSFQFQSNKLKAGMFDMWMQWNLFFPFCCLWKLSKFFYCHSVTFLWSFCGLSVVFLWPICYYSQAILLPLCLGLYHAPLTCDCTRKIKSEISVSGSIAYLTFQAISFLFHLVRAIGMGLAQRSKSELRHSSHIAIYVVPVPIQQIKSGHVWHVNTMAIPTRFACVDIPRGIFNWLSR